MASDWIEDENLSRADKLARFEALGPEQTRGPKLPPGMVFAVAVKSFNITKTITQTGSRPSPTLQMHDRPLTQRA